MDLTVNNSEGSDSVTRNKETTIDNSGDETQNEINENSEFLAPIMEVKEDGHCCIKVLKDRALRHKLLHTGCVCLSTVAMGWRLGMLGPSLPDLRLIINEDLSKASWLFSAVALGGLFGSMFGGILYDRFHKSFMFILLTFCLAVVTAATPWCSNFESMVAIHVVNGVFVQGIDTIVAADMMLVWGKNGGPFLQAVHLCFSIGAMISPLASEPFFAEKHLLNISNETDMSKYPTITHGFVDIAGYPRENSFLDHKTTLIDKDGVPLWAYGETNIHIAYAVSAIVSFIACLTFSIQHVCLGSIHIRQNKKTNTQKHMGGEDKTNDVRDSNAIETQHYLLRKNWQTVLLIILSTMLSTYVICERTFVGYLMTYLVTKLNWSKAQGSSATSTFWISFSVGRVASIFVLKSFRLLTIFVVFLGLLFLGNIVFLLAVKFQVYNLVWVACGLIGLGMSPLFVSIISWISENVCRLTGRISSVVFTITITGAIVFHFLTGHVMSTISYDWFIFLEIILSSFMMLLIFITEVMYKTLT